MPSSVIDRRRFLKACAAAYAATNLQGQGADRPNVVLIVVDNMGLDLGCYGNPVVKTPHLDALAADGVRMTNAFCTTSSCSPSRAVILTGQYAHANGMYGLQHAYHHFASFDHVRSLPTILGEAGYRTARIGKLHVGPEAVYRFDSALEADSRNPVEMAERSEQFIADDDAPFFLHFGPYDPHRGRPFNSWPEPNPFANRPEGYEGVETVEYSPEDVVVPPFLTDTPETRAELAQYYQAISRVDQGVGRLVEILKARGKYDNTLIVFLSDNGSAFPGALATLYEPGMHLPCIVRTPEQQKRGITCDAMINWADIAPTIADFAGAPPAKEQFQGRSFRGAIQSESPAGWDEIYASHTFHEVTMYQPMRVFRGRRFKLIWNIVHDQDLALPRDIEESSTMQSLSRRGLERIGKRSLGDLRRRPEFELYDLEKDPDEVNNLAGDSGSRELLAELTAKVRKFQERTNDPWVIAWGDHEGLAVVEKH